MKLILKKKPLKARSNIQVLGRFDPAGGLERFESKPFQQGVILLPSEAVRIIEVTIPGKREKLWRSALPYALEEQLAEPLDEVYIHVLTRHSKGEKAGQTLVMVVSQSILDHWHKELEAADLLISGVFLCPDFIALPEPSEQEDHCASVEERDGSKRYLVRTGTYSGRACYASVWPVVSASLQCHKPINALDDFSRTCRHLTLAEDTVRKTNLLQGPYAARGQPGRQWFKIWRMPLMLVGALVFLWALQYQFETHQKVKRANAYENLTQTLFQQAFPEIKRVVNIRAQAKSRIKQLTLEKDRPRPVWQLGRIQSILIDLSVHVESLEWKPGKWTFKIRSQDPQAFEKAIEQLNQLALPNRSLTAELKLKGMDQDFASGEIYVAID
ncbi:type II secretion system protein GspL [Thiomicrospira sp. WB1]|uniref:type II secretion system protein GspL n=1 Tax=Thiomicrospira sp. WB1 TaxID=1685380 RepID=UPI000748AF85|nr:type II secretion system protein GspL [Thiomicrospira sp. WB1]KUJ72434.1 hypothetical protein AVO41_01055 [Thiomicrospira sp. WB1]